jgi:hypothetical protein
LVLGLPNLVYQATHHWPQLSMAGAVSRNKGEDDRIQFLPLQLLLLGPALAAVWIAGIVRLFRNPDWRPVRVIGWAYLVTGVIVLVTGGQPYYAVPLLLALYAAGCVVVARSGWRRAVYIAVAVTVPISVLIALPVLPVRAVGLAAAVNGTVKDSIGWPVYVAQVAHVVDGLPPADRSVAAIVTGNYGEAGAIDRFGGAYRLPTVYSGHNELYRFGPPPDSATVAVFVGFDDAPLSDWFADCAVAGRLDNGVDVDNEEQGQPITVCRRPRLTWKELWPRLQHFD